MIKKIAATFCTLFLLNTGNLAYAEAEAEADCIKDSTQWCAEPRCKETPEVYCKNKYANDETAMASCIKKGQELCAKPRCPMTPEDYCKTHNQ